jgi:hypothetical protein
MVAVESVSAVAWLSPTPKMAISEMPRDESQGPTEASLQNHPPAPRRTKSAPACLPIAGHYHAKPGNLQAKGRKKDVGKKESNIPKQKQTLPKSALPPTDPPKQPYADVLVAVKA